MHTYNTKDERIVAIHHNADWSGDLLVTFYKTAGWLGGELDSWTIDAERLIEGKFDAGTFQEHVPLAVVFRAIAIVNRLSLQSKMAVKLSDALEGLW